MKEDLNSIFLSEASELMADLEKGLLNLETDPANEEAINKVFRAMHTLKGSAGMFGFDAVSAITHEIETIYDSIRNKEKRLTPEILRVTFETLDHLPKLFSDPKLSDALVQQRQTELLAEIHTLLLHVGSDTSKAEVAQPATLEPRWYYILFAPNENILRNGTNTLYLIDDLLTMGSGLALPYFKLPALDKLDPQLNYNGFEILLQTTKPESEMRDVFMFVDTECVLEIKPVPSHVAVTEELMQQIRQAHKLDSPSGYDKLLAVLAPEPKHGTSKKTAKEKITEAVQAKAVQTQGAKAGSSIRIGTERIDELMNLVSELVTTQARLTMFSGHNQSSELSTISENVEKITRRLRDNAFTMSLIPIESLVVRFQRLVRDLSKELHKDIVFKTEGTDTEIDKSIVEKLTDPLLHILRNSLDHGIEMPAEREKNKKPSQGTLLLKAYHSGANVVIEITDDGAGLNLQKIKQKAISKGLIAADAELSEKEIVNLIFLPGFSTAEKVTGVSGRGVGMDVVSRNIADIRGDIEVTTKENHGTTFRIRLPLMLSIFDGLLVRIGETDFILPLSSVDKCYEVETKSLLETFNQWVTLEGQRTPFIYLRKNFNINHGAPSQSQVIKMNYEGYSVGLTVDKIIGEYQAVLKPLGKFYRDQDEFSGATILGDGSVALVIDPYRLVKKLVADKNLNLN